MPIDLIPPTTRFRSTWIVSSLEGLRERGCFDRYERQLIDYRDAILSAVAGVWLPVDVVRAHYEACEKAEGGAIGVSRLANNRRRIDYVGCSLFEIAYFRRAVRFMIQFVVAHNAARATVRELPERKAHTCFYLVDWP